MRFGTKRVQYILTTLLQDPQVIVFLAAIEATFRAHSIQDVVSAVVGEVMLMVVVQILGQKLNPLLDFYEDQEGSYLPVTGLAVGYLSCDF